jgi:hypothetical protein
MNVPRSPAGANVAPARFAGLEHFMIACAFAFLLIVFVSGLFGFYPIGLKRLAGMFRILVFVSLSLFLGLTVYGLGR